MNSVFALFFRTHTPYGPHDELMELFDDVKIAFQAAKLYNESNDDPPQYDDYGAYCGSSYHVQELLVTSKENFINVKLEFE